MNWLLRLSLLVLLHCAPGWVLCQDTFQRLFPGLQNSMGNNAHISPDGGVTFATWAYDQFGPSGSDIMLISMDDQGDTVWTKTYGRPYNDYSLSMLGTADGGYLIIGVTDAIDATQQLYLIRTDAQGDTIWTRAYRRSNYDSGWNAAECSDGGFIVVGPSNYGGLYAIRVDALGDLLWSNLQDRRFPPLFESTLMGSSCVAQLADNSFIVGGNHQGGAPLMSKIDPEGNVLWTRRLNGLDTRLWEILAMPDGGWVIRLPILVDGDYDCLLVKFDALGNITWSKVYDGGGDEVLASVNRTTDGGFAVAGGTSVNIPAPHDAYFFKTDSIGQVEFSVSYGGSQTDFAHDIVEADDGGYFIVGYTKSFGLDTSSFVIKVDSTGNGDCHLSDVTTVVTDVELTWQNFDLELFPSIVAENSGACGIRSGATVLPLCPVGLENMTVDEGGIHLFPNPAHDQFTISIASDYARSEIEIFNTIGDKVYWAKANGPETVIDRTFLSDGIYLIKITTGSSTVTRKVVLE